jgi:hypothetical protein
MSPSGRSLLGLQAADHHAGAGNDRLDGNAGFLGEGAEHEIVQRALIGRIDHDLLLLRPCRHRQHRRERQSQCCNAASCRRRSDPAHPALPGDERFPLYIVRDNEEETSTMADIAFGFQAAPASDIHKSDQALYREVMADCALGQKLGYDAAWLLEHHFSDYYPTPSPLLFMAYIAAAFPRPVARHLGAGAAPGTIRCGSPRRSPC